MKKRAVIITVVFLLLSFACALAVSAVDAAATTLVPVEKGRTYYSYFNSKSAKGSVAFCLDNKFTAFGKTTDSISLCTKNADGTYTAVYTVDRSAVDVWFAGTTELKLKTGENVSSLLGGLSGLGITAESEKTNVALSLYGQALTAGTEYYVYIPAYYFVDENGNGNNAGYISIEKEKFNAYSGDLLSDLQNVADDVYDFAIRGYESVAGLVSR